MKVAFVISNNFMPLVKRTVDDLWPKIQPEYLIYDDYKEAPDLIRGKQHLWDGVLFAGKAPYYYCEKVIHPEVPWVFLPGESDTLLKALLVASNRGWNLSRLSMDSYDSSLIRNSYEDMGVDAGFIRNQLYLGDVTSQVHNEMARDFHIRNYAEQRVDGCVTRLYTVWQDLRREHVPVVFAGPTYDSINAQLDFLQRLYRAQLTGNGIFTVYYISIEYPPEYSLVLTGEYQFALERLKIGTQIYQYAEQVGGAVVEISPREYMIYSDRTIIDASRNMLLHFDLLDNMTSSTLQTVHIGIGCGSSILQAQEMAVKAKLRTQLVPNSNAYLMMDDGIGRKILPSISSSTNTNVDENLLKIAKRCGINAQTAYKIYNFFAERHCDLFTTKELANSLKISIRSANRLVEKLEDGKFISISGQVTSSDKGRPSRLFSFNIEGE